MTGDESAEVDAFRWVWNTVIRDAVCVTIIDSRDKFSVASGFGGDPSRAMFLSLTAALNESLTAAQDEFTENPWIAVRDMGSWLLVVEVNGWQGSRPEVLERISSSTRAVSAYWNVKGTTRFSHAVTGHVLTTFEALFPERRFGDDPDSLEALRTGLPWDGDDPVLPTLALAARVTGRPAEPAWFDGIFEVIPVEPLAEAIQPSVYPETEPLTYDDPPLAWALRRITDERLREAALTASQYAIGVAGLKDNSDVALALESGGSAASAGLAKLAAKLDRACRKSPGDSRFAGRFWAVTALREAANPLPLAAGFKAIAAARLAASSSATG